MNAAWYYRWRWFASLLIIGVIQRWSPWARAEDPMWFKLDGLPEPSVGMEFDGSEETSHTSGVNATYETLYITPTIGLRGTGSIYHPNLLSFDYSGELGWGYDQMTSSGPGYRQTLNESELLERYLVQIEILQEKAYNAAFSASQDHSYRDYGSFDTYTVDSTRYDGRVNWNTGNFSVNTDFGYRDETDTGLIDSSEVQETYFNFLGMDKRPSGQTTLTARWDLYDNILNVGSFTSQTESMGVSDAETFGSRKQITESAGLSVSQSEYSGQLTDTINATENVNINHRPNLDSYLIFDFQQNYLHPASDTYVQGSYGVRHQLYESLTSTLDVHGSYQDNSDGASSSTMDLFGVGVSENYQKRLQSWGHLTIGAGIIVDHVDSSSAGGAFASINEVHQAYLPTSPQYRPVFLNQPQVSAGTIQVTSSGQLLVEGTDYEIISSGDLTEIRLIAPPSSHLQGLLGSSDNLSISVSYQSNSAINAAYEALTSNFDIRLDLFGRLGIYGRLNWLDNDAPPIVLTQTLTDLVGGMDYHWRWLRTGAEYEDYDSNYSKYDALRFFQNLDFSLPRQSSLNLDLDESFYQYNGSGNQTLYQFTTRYNVLLWSSLACYVQGGCSFQQVFGTDQLDGSAQAGFSWTYGKISVRAGYEYNSQATTTGAITQSIEKNRIFAYLKRTF